MKPHLRLHITRTGEWWIGKSLPGDLGYTVSTTLNYRTAEGAIRAARYIWANVQPEVRRQLVGYSSLIGGLPCV